MYVALPARKARRGRNVTRITDLPDGLLLDILGYIDYVADYRQSYHSLCLVNQRVNALAIPCLYNYVLFEEDAKPSFPLFLRTVIQAPALLLHAKDFEWTYKPNHVVLSDSAAFAEIIKGRATPNDQSWLTAMQTSELEAFVATALALMPNIENIDYQPANAPVIDPAHPPAHLQLLLSAARGVPYGMVHSFCHLSSVSLTFNPECASLVSALFRLPSLRRLCLETCDLGPQEFDKALLNSSRVLAEWECPLKTSPITELSIFADFPCEIMDIMLKSCTSLQRLWFDGWIELANQPMWMKTVGNSLLQHQNSLNHVSFNGTGYIWPGTPESAASHLRILGSLSKLRSYVGPLALLLSPQEAIKATSLPLSPASSSLR